MSNHQSPLMGWNRSKPCEIPPYYQQIRCIKYLRSGEKAEKGVGEEDRCSGAIRVFSRSGRCGLAELWLVIACVRRWGQGRGKLGLVVVWKWSCDLVVWSVKRAVEESHQKTHWCDFALTVGPTHVCLITKMPWKLSFDNLKTTKMCFQFP